MLTVLLAVTVGAAHVGSAVLARHRAQAAADMAALAAASRLSAGSDAACAQAAAIARAMGAALHQCRVESLDAVVAVEVPIAVSLPAGRAAHAAARAGPALADDR